MTDDELQEFFRAKAARADWWTTGQAKQEAEAEAAQPAPEPVDVSKLDPGSAEYAELRNQLGVIDEPFGERRIHRESAHKYQTPIPRYRGQPGPDSLRKQDS